MKEHEKLMLWIDNLRESKPWEIGALTDDDYALIFDRHGVSWRTETLTTGEQVKSINNGWALRDPGLARAVARALNISQQV